MKPLYILERYDAGSVRRQRATIEEIRAVVDGKSSDRLAHVEIDDDGDIVAHPLTVDELARLGTELEAELTRRLHEILDTAASLARKAHGLDGIMLGSFGVATVWVATAARGSDRIAIAWAEARGFEVRRSSPPRDRKRWYPDATVSVGGVDIVRVVWPEVEINTEKAVAEEIETIEAERAEAAREMEAF